MVYKYKWCPPVGQVSACAMSGAIYDADRVPSEFALTVARLLPEEERVKHAGHALVAQRALETDFAANLDQIVSKSCAYQSLA